MTQNTHRNAGAAELPPYRPEHWRAKEVFTYVATGGVVSAELRVEFRKTQPTTATVSADSLIRIPLRKPLQFHADTLFSSEPRGPILFDSFSERSGDGTFVRTTSQQNGRLIAIEERHGKRGTENEIIIEPGCFIANPLQTLIHLRDVFHSGFARPRELSPVVVGRKRYRLVIKPEPERSFRGRLTIRPADVQETSTLREIEFGWDPKILALSELRFKVPVFGSIALRLKAHDCSAE